MLHHVLEEVVVVHVLRDLPLHARRAGPHVLREPVQVDPRVYADPDHSVERVAAVHALAQDPADLLLHEHDVVRPLQVREDAEVPEGLHDGHPRQEPEGRDVLRVGLYDEGDVQPPRRRGPRAAVAALPRALPLRDENRPLVGAAAEEELRDLVRRVHHIKPEELPEDRARPILRGDRLR